MSWTQFQKKKKSLLGMASPGQCDPAAAGFPRGKALQISNGNSSQMGQCRIQNRNDHSVHKVHQQPNHWQRKIYFWWNLLKHSHRNISVISFCIRHRQKSLKFHLHASQHAYAGVYFTHLDLSCCHGSNKGKTGDHHKACLHNKTQKICAC